MRDRRVGRTQGSVTVEMAIAMPIVIVIVMAGFQLGRALLTHHRLADATAYAARAAAAANDTTAGTVDATVRKRLDREAGMCTQLQVSAQVVAGPYPGSQALEVKAVCMFKPMFKGPWMPAALTPSTITSVAAMPL